MNTEPEHSGEQGSAGDVVQKYFQTFWRKAVRNTVIGLVVFGAIWGAMNSVVPDGGWQIPINIVALLVTLGVAAQTKRFLEILGTNGWLAMSITIAIWLVAVVGVRSVVLAALDG